MPGEQIRGPLTLGTRLPGQEPRCCSRDLTHGVLQQAPPTSCTLRKFSRSGPWLTGSGPERVWDGGRREGEVWGARRGRESQCGKNQSS